MTAKQCIVEGCTATVVTGRRYCREHYLKRKRDAYYAHVKAGTYHPTMYEHTCSWCGRPFTCDNNHASFCSRDCNRAVNAAVRSISKHKTSKASGKEAWLHKHIAVQAIGMQQLENKSLHHKDFDPENNDLSNLLVLDRKTHAALHAFIRREAAKRTTPNEPNRQAHMFAMIPDLTDEFFRINNIIVDSVQDIKDRAQ